MHKRNIYCVGPVGSYANWMECELTNNMEKADAVLFTGGEDVCPEIYGQPTHFTTNFNLSRDKYEMPEFKKARQLNIPLIGICRGSQFICAMSGGILVQDQGASGFHHKLNMYDGSEIVTTSSHHQAQYPWKLIGEGKAFILGWTFNESRNHKGGNNEELVRGVVPDNKEVEICYYKNTNALGIQGHPEWMVDHKDITYYQNLLNKFLNKELDKELGFA